MPAVIAAVLGVAFYLGLCGLFVYFVIVPSFVWLVAGGAAVGALAGLGIAAHAVLTGRAPLLGPADVNDVTLFPRHESGYGRDRVWPHYLARQGRDDLVAAARAAGQPVGRIWTTAALVVLEQPGALVVWPLLALVLIPTVAATAGLLLATGVFLLVGGAALGVATALWGGVGVLLRRGDALLRRRNRAWAECPVCFHHTTLPSYACACGTVHRDVRPSRLGVLVHHCGCGRAMPTTVSRAGRQHAAQCPKCDQPLVTGSGVWTAVSVPVLGPVSAGKTSFVYASLAALHDVVVRSGGTFAPSGEASEAQYAAGVEQVRNGRVTKTDTTPPVGLVIRVSDGTRDGLLHTYDAAGEFFSSRELNRSMRFLDHAEQMVLIVDPFSIPAVADEAYSLEEAAPAAEPPEEAYSTTVLRVRDDGVDLGRIALAVVVVKADLLVGLPGTDDLRPESDSVQAWLCEQRLDHLVAMIEGDFRTFRYFLVSSRTGVDPADRYSAAAPLRWLAESAQLPLPAAIVQPRREGAA